MDIADLYDIDQTAAELTRRFGRRVTRASVTAWARDGVLPSFKRGKTTLVPRSAVALFEPPRRGRNVGRENLARGVGLALRTLGQVAVPDRYESPRQFGKGATGMLANEFEREKPPRGKRVEVAVLQAACPRCGGPWVIRGGVPVVGHEADLCCCNLDCLYVGSDFLHRAEPDSRVTRDGDAVTMRAK
jgi:hypothetical protein